MQKLLKLCAAGLILMLMSASPHKFYVSKTTVDYNGRTEIFEVTCKLFTDDFEKVLSSAEGHDIRLEKNSDPGITDALVEKYLKAHLVLNFDDKRIEMRYVGKEVEADLTFCYLEFYHLPAYRTILVENTLFHEIYSDQQNIVDIQVNGSTKTAILTKDKSKELISR